MTEGQRRMSRYTYDVLTIKKKTLEEELKRQGSESSGHQRASLHDDPAAENALNLTRANLQIIGDLNYVDIIEPRENVDTVGLGNEVHIAFEGEDEVEAYVLLGRDDALYRRDGLSGKIISIESPLGEAILGRQEGDRVSFKAGKNEIFVRVNQIRPGDF